MKYSLVVALIVALLSPVSSSAQNALSSSAIAGQVKDTSGAVLPGVTVSAESPALIEKTRIVVTDGEGRYRITDLRPGTYAVAFTLSGFRAMRREGIELTTGFTATVNADLSLGNLEETITVSGSAPLVDVQGSVQQQVFSREVLAAVAIGKNAGAVAAMVPAAIVPVANIDVGGTRAENTQLFTIHNSGSQLQLRDGVFYGIPNGAGNFNSSVNPATVQEVNVQMVGGLSAEAMGNGPQVNYVPRDGGNVFSGSLVADYGNKHLQGNNTDEALRARGATLPTQIRTLRDISGSFGGPIKQDKLWFFAATRRWDTETYVPGVFFNQKPYVGTLFYVPDTSRQGWEAWKDREVSVRFTWQATPRNKITFTPRTEWTCQCYTTLSTAGNVVPESVQNGVNWPYNQWAGHWTSPVTSRLLLDVAGLWQNGETVFDDDSHGTAIPVFDRIANRWYGGAGASLSTRQRGEVEFFVGNVNSAVSYVTGSHAVKVGLQWRYGHFARSSVVGQGFSYTFNGSAPGTAVPQSVTYFAQPLLVSSYVAQTMFFAQDQWTIDRLTLGYGTRVEFVDARVPAIQIPASQYAAAFDAPAVSGVPAWREINPRVGASYDLFGNGRTAIKGGIGRYTGLVANASNFNPTNNRVVQASRTWNDNGDYVPQESELGPLLPVDFGSTRPTIEQDPAILRGWGVQPYSWQASTGIQHELMDGLALNVAYFRTWYGNFTVTDNRNLSPADFSPFCVTAPNDSRFPSGVPGSQICGNIAITPEASRRPANSIQTFSSKYGKQSNVHDGVDVTLNSRMQWVTLSGGLTVGRTTTDNCEVLRALPEAATTASPEQSCRVSPTLGAGTQARISAVLRLPQDFQVSTVYQNVPPVPTTATWSAPNAAIAPGLGRNLAACPATGACTATANIDLIPSQTFYVEKRLQLVSVAVNRNFQTAGLRLSPRLELHNATNSDAVTGLNNTYSGNGAAWQQVRNVIAPRMLKLSIQVEF